MKAVALEQRPAREWILLAVAGVLSLTVHCAGALGAAAIPPPDRTAPVWVEMAIVEPVPEVVPQPDPEPEPEPVPEPEPEPQPKPVSQEVVDYTPEPEVPPDPKPIPPEAKPVPRPVQGLTADSFANTGDGSFVARTGNTTATQATSEALAPDAVPGEFAIVPYTAVTKPPKIRYKPTLPIPQSIIDGQIEGRVEIVLTIDGAGLVTQVELVQGLHPDADAACITSMRASRWKAGTKDEVAVITQNVPYSCRFQMAVD